MNCLRQWQSGVETPHSKKAGREGRKEKWEHETAEVLLRNGEPPSCLLARKWPVSLFARALLSSHILHAIREVLIAARLNYEREGSYEL